MKWKENILEFFYLIYPHICAACHQRLYRQEKIICMHCENELYTTGFEERLKNNVVYNQFIGRIPISEAYAHYHFNKGSVLQELIHELKYKNRHDIGVYLGENIGEKLIDSELAHDLFAIVPLPLHQKKQLKRGFNQSTLIAQGISNILKVPIDEKIIMRSIENPSQTKQNRYTRWDNVENIFKIIKPAPRKGCKILLIDDVITTGATMEACSIELLNNGYEVAIASVATVL